MSSRRAGRSLSKVARKLILRHDGRRSAALGYNVQNLTLFAPLIAASVAVIGWFAAHRFNVYRDRQNKRRDMIIQYLLEAYRRLEAAANRDQSEEQALAFESAIADIQLLGSSAQIDATVKYLRSHASNGGALIDEVLCLLRNDLRKELGLAPPKGNPLIFRFDRHFDNGNSKSCQSGDQKKPVA